MIKVLFVLFLGDAICQALYELQVSFLRIQVETTYAYCISFSFFLFSFCLLRHVSLDGVILCPLMKDFGSSDERPLPQVDA